MSDDDFEWDDAKNIANFGKHGVTFEHARLVFADAFAVSEIDDRKEYGEDRFNIVGMVQGTLLFVAYTERVVQDEFGTRDCVRVITARRATKHEQNDYFQQNSQAP